MPKLQRRQAHRAKLKEKKLKQRQMTEAIIKGLMEGKK